MNFYSKVMMLVFLLPLFVCSTEAEITPDIVMPYKTIQNGALNIHLFFPKDHKKTEQRAAIVFFHGGGWNDGSAEQFYRQSQYFSSLGLVAVSVEYRVKKQHGSTPKESVFDARSAMRFIKQYGGDWGINVNQIVVAGGSAGGHLALATALLDFNDTNDNLAISTMPMALILYNPIINTGPEGYGYNWVKDYWLAISPVHNLSKHLPPTLILLGTHDHLVPVSQAEEFIHKCNDLKLLCELELFQDQKHGFFNHAKYAETLASSEAFLKKLGLLEQ